MELKWQPFPHLSPTTEALSRPEAAALPGDTAPLAQVVARAAVEELVAFMVEAPRAEVVHTEAVVEVARAGAVHTEEAEARVAEAPVEVAVLQAEVAAAAIARIKTSADRQ
jgi:hypothetical protein